MNTLFIQLLAFISIVPTWQQTTIITAPKIKQCTTKEVGSGEILKVERFNRQGNCSQVTKYRAGSVKSVTKFTYDAENRLKKSVENHDNSWDYIQEFDYDSRGNLSFLLWGNNRTGVWGSHQMIFDQYNNILRKDFHLKNGTLDYSLAYEYEYDENGKVLSEKSMRVPAGGRKPRLNYYNTYEYDQAGNRTKVNTLDETGRITDYYAYQFSGKRKTKESYYEGGVLIYASTFTYQGGKITKKITTESGRTSTTIYSYNKYGLLTSEITTAYNGAKSGLRKFYSYY